MEDQTSDEYLAQFSHEIGVLVLGCSLFDDDITNIISESLRLNQLQENALLRPMSTRAKTDLLVRIGKMFMSASEARNLINWSERFKKTLDQRNDIIHGAPVHVEERVHIRTWSGKNRMLGQSEAWPRDRVKTLRTLMADLNIEMNTKLLPLFQRTFVSTTNSTSVDLAHASPQTPQAE